MIQLGTSPSKVRPSVKQQCSAKFTNHTTVTNLTLQSFALCGRTINKGKKLNNQTCSFSVLVEKYEYYACLLFSCTKGREGDGKGQTAPYPHTTAANTSALCNQPQR